MEIIRREDCNPLSDDIAGKLVVVNVNRLVSDYKSAKYQLVLATGGFGCKADSLGNAVYVTECCSDPDRYRLERYNLIGEPTQDLLDAWKAEYGEFNSRVLDKLAEVDKLEAEVGQVENDNDSRPTDTSTKPDWRDIPNFIGRYKISKDGQIRTKSNKPKKVIKDAAGHKLVIFDDVAYSVEDLVREVFGEYSESESQTVKLSNTSTKDFVIDVLRSKVDELEAKLSAANKKIPRNHYIIHEVGTSRIFKTYADCAATYGFDYDQFYNAFYTSKQAETESGTITIEFKGYKFERINTSKEESK